MLLLLERKCKWSKEQNVPQTLNTGDGRKSTRIVNKEMKSTTPLHSRNVAAHCDYYCVATTQAHTPKETHDSYCCSLRKMPFIQCNHKYGSLITSRQKARVHPPVLRLADAFHRSVPPPLLRTPSPPLPHGFGTEHAERPSFVALLPFSPVGQSVKLSTRLQESTHSLFVHGGARQSSMCFGKRPISFLKRRPREVSLAQAG